MRWPWQEDRRKGKASPPNGSGERRKDRKNLHTKADSVREKLERLNESLRAEIEEVEAAIR